MVNMNETYLKEILEKVAAVFNLDKWNHSQLQFENIGQNYFGTLVPLEISGKRNGKVERIRLVLKLAPTDERYRVSGALTLMFAREIFVYSTLIREYQAAQQKYALSPFLVPSCYYTCQDNCREVVVLQDMTAEGFKPYTHTTFLDFKHTVISLVSLAMFHAHSFILRQNDKKLYAEATKVCVPLTLQSNKRYMEVLEDRLLKAIQNFGDTAYASLFKALKANHVRLVEEAWDSVKDTCICHGDIWKENILYNYKLGEPVSSCLIDYQTARVSSPAFDVLYLIASSTTAVVRRQHYCNLIDAYYKRFHLVLTEAGLDSREVYSRESLECDLKTVAPACLIVANTALWLASGCQQEGHVRSKCVLNTEDERKAAVQSYKVKIKDIIDDFRSFGYLDTMQGDDVTASGCLKEGQTQVLAGSLK